ncbi:MAG: hypothetical protein KAV01_01615 [Candidatus Lokiarchaeota archaeon]|nr:hypothetical protein [Candidatus Lokiarchaeota archaeon]MCK4479198.1 hypothetical protein [Candidatus Lokiarchaeota archaeon]
MSINERKIPTNKDLKKILNNRNPIIENQEYIQKEGLFRKYPCSFCYFIIGVVSFTPALLLSELTISYLKILSLAIGVFSVIGLLIYCTEYKSYKKDMRKTTTEDIFGGIQITESVKGGKNSIVILILFIIGFWIYVSMVLIIVLGGIIAIWVVIIIWIIIGFFMYGIYRLVIRGTSELRKFIVTDSYIKIIVPPRPIFHVDWIDIDKIELKLKPFKRIHSVYGTSYIYIHELNFIGKDYNQAFEVLGGRDFSKKLNEVFVILEKYAIKMNKEFIRFEKK